MVAVEEPADAHAAHGVAHEHRPQWTPSLASGTIALLSRVHKEYPLGETYVSALRDVNLILPKHEFVVVLGPSGSGKTTLLNLLGGIESPTHGDVWVDGEPLHAMSTRERTTFRRHKIGFVFQFFNLIATLTARENVELASRLTTRSSPALEVLEDVGLEERANQFPSQLSGGEQQRVAIARAIVRNPPLLLCDEPTGNLDVDTGRRVLGVLHGLCRRNRVSVILVTHNAAIASMADRVVRMHDGAIAAVEPNRTPVAPADVEW